MNDRYKFRGKRVDNGEWVHGWLLTNKLGTYIIIEENPHECTQYGYIEINEYARVIPETVGQYTGLKDKNDKLIFEGDIILDKEPCFDNLYGVAINLRQFTVKYNHATCGFTRYNESSKMFFGNIGLFDIASLEVIGNIHENPELLEGSGENV